MVKHTQKPTNYLSVFDHFVGLALKGLKGDCRGFRRRKNFKQLIIFKQSNFFDVFVFFLILKCYLSNHRGSDLKQGYSTSHQSTMLNNKPALTLPSV